MQIHIAINTHSPHLKIILSVLTDASFFGGSLVNPILGLSPSLTLWHRQTCQRHLVSVGLLWKRPHFKIDGGEEEIRLRRHRSRDPGSNEQEWGYFSLEICRRLSTITGSKWFIGLLFVDLQRTNVSGAKKTIIFIIIIPRRPELTKILISGLYEKLKIHNEIDIMVEQKLGIYTNL